MAQGLKRSWAAVSTTCLGCMIGALSIPSNGKAQPATTSPNPSQAQCHQAFSKAPWEKSLYEFPALALGAGPGWRMLINKDVLVELYITDWDGQCWDINRNPITSGAKKVETTWQGQPGKPDGGEKYHYKVIVDNDKLILVLTDKERCQLSTVAGNYPSLVNCKAEPDSKHLLGLKRHTLAGH